MRFKTTSKFLGSMLIIFLLITVTQIFKWYLEFKNHSCLPTIVMCTTPTLCTTTAMCNTATLCTTIALRTTNAFHNFSSNIDLALLERNQIFSLQVVCIIIIQNLKYFAAILFVGAPQTQKSLGTLHWLAICIESIMQLLKGRWLSKPLE